MKRPSARNRWVFYLKGAMMKRAAIYIRVSSEKQADKVSPEAQEADCRALCEHKGYQVVGVYSDTEKYRVGKRLVEPSGTRADRPQLKRLLADARADVFEVIVAWREDRLYRSYRPMLDVLDTLDETHVDIELAKETFDRRIAPVKAWAARMELDAKHDRYMMGIAGRLESGKHWNHPAPYGYSKGENGEYIVNPTEAQWIQNLFRWYGEGATYGEIRKRFISGGAPQRKENTRRMWQVALLCRYLKAEHYWSGFHYVKWDGTLYPIQIPPIVTQEEMQRVKDRQARYKKYPAGNAKHDALAAGIIYCSACNTAMRVTTRTNGYTRMRDGKRKVWIGYICCSYGNRVPSPCCVMTAGVKSVDEQIWRKVWALISVPGKMESAIQKRIEELQAEQANAEIDTTRIAQQLEAVMMERQWVITQARKGRITDDDMEIQLLELDIQAKTLRRELDDARLMTGNRATRLKDLALTFREQLREGWDVINAEPETEEQAKLLKDYQRKLVQGICKRVWVHQDKTVNLDLEFNLPEIVSISTTATPCP
jgi:DNA invertase Pin-like site-specific DNA recombinase